MEENLENEDNLKNEDDPYMDYKAAGHKNIKAQAGLSWLYSQLIHPPPPPPARQNFILSSS